MKKYLAVLLLCLSSPLAASTGPEELIRDTSSRVLAELKSNMASYSEDPAQVHRLIDEMVLPHFDFAAMTDLALGKFKDEVSAEQKPAIVSEFRQLLVRTYSSALLEYTDQEIVYLPMEGTEADGQVVVRIEIEQAGGFPIPIHYRMRQGENGWKVFDISVDEVSLVTNYRSSFARAIKKNGVDGLIQTLQERNESQ
ncbi:MAG: ABC transporter substrate-binding protein [Gammaproteobacteria bacterium]|nr:ABC transporter substrate-binding protein [Gammaproteobacteria bacterium]